MLRNFVFLMIGAAWASSCAAPSSVSDGRPDRPQAVLEARAALDSRTLTEIAAKGSFQTKDLAWRALANVAVSDTDSLLALALRADTPLAYAALATQTWTLAQVVRLNGIWVSDPSRRGGLCRVLGMAGDASTRELLRRYRMEWVGSSHEADCALALNRRYLAAAPDAVMASELVGHAYEARDPLVQRAWLYGLYRTRAAWLDDSALWFLYSWITNPPDQLNPFTAQVIVHILGKHRDPALPALLATEGPLVASHGQRVEAVRAVFRYERFDNAHHDALRHLLRSALDDGNVPIGLEILASAETHPAAVGINLELAHMALAHEDVHEAVRMAAMRIAGIRPVRIPYNPALTLDYIRLMGDSTSIHMDMATHPDPIRALLALQGASAMVARRPELAEVLMAGLRHPRPQVADFALSQLRGQGYWSQAQEQDHAEQVLEMERRTAKVPGLRVPAADILERMPIWTLETTEGRIVMELDGRRAPASTAAIVELTRAGYYDGTFFHRVIRNFVIQAGYSLTGDRLDVPFTLPTEAIEDGFERGRVGVASLGRDTEGGQFFIMHQWTPHLDGAYSNIGRVVEGMDVVDRVWQGTLIRKASIRLP